MKRRRFLYVLGALVLACCLTAGPVQGEGGLPKSQRLFDIDLILEPGEWQGYYVRQSSACGGYMVEVSPLERSVDGAYVAKALVQPEYNSLAEVWWDVLRVQIPADQPALPANVRVYSSCPLPVVLDEDIALEPGFWIDRPLGPSSQDRGYVVEMTPLQPSNDGASMEAMVRQEFLMGEWNDVLRVTISPLTEPFTAKLRVYSTAAMPVSAEFEIELQPGEWTGLPLQLSSVKGAYVVEVNPLEAPKGSQWLEQAVVQPEFDGTKWHDVVRLLLPEGQPGLNVQVRVYRWVP